MDGLVHLSNLLIHLKYTIVIIKPDTQLLENIERGKIQFTHKLFSSDNHPIILLYSISFFLVCIFEIFKKKIVHKILYSDLLP